MNHSNAQQLASHLVDYMFPHCDNIVIAGSVRRGVPECGDIEIVAIPSWETRTIHHDLFPDVEAINLLHEAVESSEFIQWIKPGTSEIESWPIKPGGKYWRGLIKRGRFDSPADIKLDLFLCREDNFGVIYTIRTGAADFSRELVTYARDHTPYRIAGGNLTQDNFIVPSPDEETLFASLNLEWIAPQMRRGKNDIRRIAAWHPQSGAVRFVD